MKNKVIGLALILCSGMFLTGCSSSSSGNNNPGTDPVPPPVNQAPSVMVNDFTAPEQTMVQVAVTATDPDGTITAYNWTQTSGATVSLSGQDTEILNFEAPVAKDPIELGFSITVTDDDGETTTDSLIVTIDPVNEISFTYSAKVTTAVQPVPNANVAASFAGMLVTTTTDANGDFEFVIEADEDLAEEQLYIEVVGDGQSELIHLFNLPKSLSAWQQLAGDNTLDANDSIDVNVTHFTTALHALLTELNQGVAPQDIAEIAQLSKSLDSTELMATATIISLIAENHLTDPTLALESGQDTYSVALDKSLRSSLVLRQISAPTYQDYYLAQASNQNVFRVDNFAFAPSYLSAGGKINYAADGSGQFIEQQGATSFQWALQNDGSYLRTFDEAIELGLIDTFEAQYLVSNSVRPLYSNPSFVLHQGDSNIEVRDVRDNSLVRSVDTPEFYTYEYPFPEPLGFAVELSGQLTIPVPGIVFSSEVITDTSVGPLTTFVSRQGETFTLNSDGSVATRYLGIGVGSWVIDNGGRVILTFTNYTFTIERLTNNQYYTEVDYLSEGSMVKSALIGDGSYNAAPTTVWTEDMVPGTYTLDWRATEDNRFWLELQANGQAVTRSLFDRNGNGDISDDEPSGFYGDWFIENGVLKITRYFGRDEFGNCPPDSCTLFHTREIILGETVGDRVYATNRHIFTLYALDYPGVADVADLPDADYTDSRYWLKSNEPQINQRQEHGRTNTSTKRVNVDRLQFKKELQTESLDIKLD